MRGSARSRFFRPCGRQLHRGLQRPADLAGQLARSPQQGQLGRHASLSSPSASAASHTPTATLAQALSAAFRASAHGLQGLVGAWTTTYWGLVPQLVVVVYGRTPTYCVLIFSKKRGERKRREDRAGRGSPRWRRWLRRFAARWSQTHFGPRPGTLMPWICSGCGILYDRRPLGFTLCLRCRSITSPKVRKAPVRRRCATTSGKAEERPRQLKLPLPQEES